jgi:hypothetical protein
MRKSFNSNTSGKCKKDCSVAKPRYKKSDAVNHLQALALEAIRRKYPNYPERCLAPRKYRDDSANCLTRCIIDFLRLKGWQAERIANMGRQISTVKAFRDVTGKLRVIGSTKWVTGSGTNGTADISSIIKARSVKIEIKFGQDRQSENQRLYQESVERAGGIYVIASTFDQFLAWYKIFTYEK